MGKAKLSSGEIAQEFLHGRNCAQCVLGEYARTLGYDRSETDRIAACFGGGMGLGQTCGAVTGALMVIGMVWEDKETAAGRAADFCAQFTHRHGSCMCRDLLGCDLSKPEQAEQAKAAGQLLQVCPMLVESALCILDEFFE